ncbi:MAG: hypothetical protein MUF54_15645, partial [Polyangiaceae bacterium]|nr:hypothetical protein [Polyangiaceae bacterium]
LRQLRGGQSSFPLVLEKLELLHRRLGHRLPGVRMTVSPETAADLVHNVAFFLDRGFRTVYFAPVAEATWSPAQLAVYEQQQHQLAESWIAALRTGRPWFSTGWNKALARREAIRKGVYAGEHAVVCGAGTTMLAVDIYGDIFPCHRFAFYDKAARSHAMGNVRGFQDEAVSLPQMRFDPTSVRLPEASDPPAHPNAYQQICPALNCAMCGDIHRVPARLGTLSSIEERVLDGIEDKVLQDPAYREFLDKYLLPTYRWGELSSSTIMLLSRVTTSNPESLTDKAEAILQRLQQQRRAPGEQSP